MSDAMPKSIADKGFWQEIFAIYDKNPVLIGFVIVITTALPLIIAVLRFMNKRSEQKYSHLKNIMSYKTEMKKINTDLEKEKLKISTNSE